MRFICLFMLLGSFSVSALEEIQLTDPTEITDAISTFKIVTSVLPSEFYKCGKTAKECACDFRTEYEKMIQAKESFMRKYPKYAGKSIDAQAITGTDRVSGGVATEAQITASKKLIENCSGKTN